LLLEIVQKFEHLFMQDSATKAFHMLRIGCESQQEAAEGWFWNVARIFTRSVNHLGRISGQICLQRRIKASDNVIKFAENDRASAKAMLACFVEKRTPFCIDNFSSRARSASLNAESLASRAMRSSALNH